MATQVQTGTAFVKHAPSVNGTIEGSIQQMLAESVNLNGGAIITNDLLVPGAPTVRLNGNPNFGGIVVGTGTATPTSHQITLSGNARLGKVRTRTNATTLPTVAAFANPTGTRTLTVNSTGQNLGNFATLRNLTLNGGAGQYTIPAGNYGDFTGNGGTGFTFGVAGATQPSVYYFQSLTLNGQNNIVVSGPVVIYVANGFTSNGTVGNSTYPDRLQIKIVTGGLIVNGGGSVYGYVTAPSGTVIVNGNACLSGGVIADGLTVNGSGLLRLWDMSTTTNQPPVANAQSITLNEDVATALALTATDPDTAILTYTVLTQPNHGTLTGTAPNLTYTPAANYFGSDSFTFKAYDGASDSAAATISLTITPVNDLPMAQPQSVSLGEDTPTALLLKGTDVETTTLTYSVSVQPTHGTLSGTAPNLTYTPAQDYNGVDSFRFRVNDGTAYSAEAIISLTITPVQDIPVAANLTLTLPEDGSAGITLNGTDPDGDPLVFSVIAQPLHGTLSGTSPDLVYTPAANYNGPDSFTYQASDGRDLSAVATVSISVTPVNDAPLAGNFTVETNEDTAKAIVLIGSDVDGDALTYDVTTQPANGTLSGTAPNLTYTPVANYYGADSFTYTVKDGSITSASATVGITVSPVNDAPVANTQTLVTLEDTSLSVVLTAQDLDGDGLVYTIVQSPAYGTLSGTAPNLTYTPAANYNGADSFTFRVNDGTANSAVATVSLVIAPVNDAPAATSQSLTANEDTAISLVLGGTDIDGDSLTYTIDTPPAHGTLTGTAPNLIYTPATDYNGSDSFSFKANDVTTDSADATISLIITPVNDAPVATSQSLTTNEDTAKSIVLSGTDVDGDPLTYTIVAQPTHGTLSGKTPNLIYTPAANYNGTDSFTFKGNDGMTDSSAATISLAILSINDAPTVNLTSPTQGNVFVYGAPISLAVSASDIDGSVVKVAYYDGPTKIAESATSPFNLSWNTANSGSHSLTAVATDNEGASATSSTVSIAVNNPNLPPTVSITAPVNNTLLAPAQALSISATAADSDGSVSLVEFYLDNAKIGEDSTAPYTFTWSGTATGSHTLTAKATDNGGLSSISSPIAIAWNAAPLVNAGADLGVTFPAAANLNGSVSDDGLPVGSTPVVSWSKISGPGNVTFENVAQSVTTAAFSQIGSYTLRLTATDGPASAFDEVTIVVAPANVAALAQPKTIQTDEDKPASVTLSATDANGDSLTFRVVTQPAHGTLSGSLPALLYTPAANYNGSDSFTYLANDGTVDSAIAAVSIAVAPVNDLPVAISQSLVLTNGGTQAVTLTATDADGDPLTFVASTQPRRGTLTGTAPNLTYTASNGACGTDTFNFTVTDGYSAPVTGTISLDILVGANGTRSRTYTTAADFSEGELSGLSTEGNTLQTTIDQSSFDYVWVPIHTKGTVVRLDTETGRVLGEYRTVPSGLSSSPYPSRVTIDSRGNAWIANERTDSIVMIANPDGPDWVDRNHNGKLDTSLGLDDIKAWNNPAGVDTNGGVTTAEDELIVRYVKVSTKFPRFISVDGNDDVWVGSSTEHNFQLIDSSTGVVSRSETSVGRGGNGGFVDLQGVLWSVGSDYLRWNTSRALNTVPPTEWAIQPDNMWTSAKDSSGNMWFSREPGEKVWKYDPRGNKIGEYYHGYNSGQGMAIDEKDDIWVAHTHCGYDVGHLKKDGSWLGNIPTAHGPNGISVDRKGRIWVTTAYGVVQRINPLAGPLGTDGVTPVGAVDLTTQYLGGNLWVDTGFAGNSRLTSGKYARWTTVYDGCLENSAWGPVKWNADLCNGAQLKISVAASNDPNGFQNLQAITPLNSTPQTLGRYLLVKAEFVPAASGESPILYDLTVGSVGYPAPALGEGWSISAGEDFQANWPDLVVIHGKICQTAASTDVIRPNVTWSLVSGPGSVQFDDPTKTQPKAQFSTPGVYVLRMVAVNGGETKTSNVTVTLVPRNRSPFVDAGEDVGLHSFTESRLLEGTVRDDGLPAGSTLIKLWKKKYGPGTVTFSNAADADTLATFSANGIYTLELSATDGEFTASDIVEVRVGAFCTIEEPKGLVSWWQGNGNGADHISGNEAYLEKGASIVDGYVGAAFNFDGVDDHALVFRSPTTDVARGGSFSLEMWVNSGYLGYYNYSQSVLAGWHNGVTPGVLVKRPGSANPSDFTVDIYDTTGTVHQTGWVNMPLQSWHHLAVTYDKASGIAKVYVDGAVASITNLGSFTPQTGYDFYMGGVPGVTTMFSGQLDEVSLYNRALDGAEINDVYAAGIIGKCPSDNNRPPVVSAGPNKSTITTPYTVSLQGSVTDDGEPDGSVVSKLWSKVSGPGNVSFANPSAAITNAVFDQPGLYTVRLTADDTLNTVSDLVEVRVAATCDVSAPSGLAAWWPGNGDFREVVAGKDGRNLSGTIFTNGEVSQAFSFNGSNSAVKAFADPQIDVASSGSFSLEMWVNSGPLGYYAYSQSVLAGWHNGITPGVLVKRPGTADPRYVLAEIYDTTGTAHLTSGVYLPLESWHHLAVTYDQASGLAKIYVDGAVASITNLGSFTPQTSYDFYIGGVPGKTEMFYGKLDEVSLYNRALDAGEIYDVYSTGTEGKCPASGNEAPIVSAGRAKSVSTAPYTVTLEGQVSDDQLPLNSTLTSVWSFVSGPGTVSFGNVSSPTSTATFSAPGLYVLKLEANDTEHAASDLVEVRVAATCDVSAPSGLAAWWPGNGDFREVVAGKDGRNLSGTSFTNGEVSQAFSFNGTNSAVKAFADSQLDVAKNGSFTMEMWVNSGYLGYYAYSQSVVAGWHNGTTPGVQVKRPGFYDPRYFQVEVYDTTGLSHGTNWIIMELQSWHHFAVTYDQASGVAKVYVDGAVASITNLGSFTPQTGYDFYMGGVPGKTEMFSGQLDEVSLYNRALDAGEIYDVYSTGVEGKCPVGANEAPVVSAGPAKSVSTAPYTVTLEGQVSDDNLPVGSPLTADWSLVSGPGTVTFGNPALPTSTATFSAPGLYVLKLEANDTEHAASDLVEVRVAATCDVSAPSGLAAWWPGNGDFREVVAGKDGRNLSGTSFTNGEVSQAFSFNGTNSAVKAFADPQLEVAKSGSFSLEMWVNQGYVSYYSYSQSVLAGWHNGTTLGVLIKRPGTADPRYICAEITDTTGAAHLTNWVYVPLESWHHLALTYDQASGVAKIYVDGAVASITNLGSFTPQTSYDFYMGGVPGKTEMFYGQLDEVSLYNRALDAGEVYDVYSTGVEGKCPVGANEAPVVSAGPAKSVSTAPYTVTLEGQVSDDNLPVGSPLTADWSLVSGPGTVTFGNPASPTSTATFSAPGLYVLKLEANDTEHAASDLVEVRVAATCEVAAPSGLAAWWPGNGDFREVVAGKDGRNLSGTSFVNGEVSQAFSFNGSNSAVKAFADPQLDVAKSGSFSLEMWVNPGYVGYYSYSQSVLAGWHNGTTPGVLIKRPGTADPRYVRAEIYDTTGTAHLTNWAYLPLESWHHFAVTYDQASGVATVYVDGSVAGATNLGSFTPQTSYDFYIGGVPGAGEMFSGQLDEVSLYDRALDPSEISGIYQACGKQPFVRNKPPQVVAGADRSVTLPTASTLTATVIDDGLPTNGTLTTLWTQVSGPVAATIAAPTTKTTGVSFAQAGSYTFQITANDGEFTRSDTLTVTVLNDPRTAPTLAITSPLENASLAAGSTTFTAQASDADGTVAKVEFFVDGQSVGSDNAAPYSVTTEGILLGTHAVTAQATDNDGLSTFSAPVGFLTVPPLPPIIGITQPVSGQRVLAGTAYTLAATASDPDGAIAKVEFYEGSTKLGEDLIAPYTLAWTPANAGAATLTAVATDSQTLSTTSAPVAVTVVSDSAIEPTIEITVPDDGGTISQPTMVKGTADSPILKDWLLRYRKLGEKCLTWEVIGSGTSAVIDSDLALFDTSLLRNGLYEVELVINDLRGGNRVIDQTVNVDGNLKVGHFTVGFDDLTIPLAGIPITINRHYDSRDKCSGDFGVGWNLDVDTVKVTKKYPIGSAWTNEIVVNFAGLSYGYMNDAGPHNVVVEFPGGRQEIFLGEMHPSAGANVSNYFFGDDRYRIAPWQNTDPFTFSLVAQPRTQGKLTALGVPANLYMFDNSPGEVLWMNTPQADIFDTEFSDASGYRYTAQDGRVFEFDAAGRLVKMTDLNNNVLSFNRSGSAGTLNSISHSSGRTITFVRDGQGRITRIVDPNGNPITYGYNSLGDLLTVTNRAGETISHTYDAKHDLLDIIDPSGVRALRNDYDTGGRLTKTIDAEGKTTTFTHNLTGKTETITDRLGHNTTHVYDTRGNILSTTDTLGRTTTTTYDARDNKLTETNPLGQTMRYAYDAGDRLTTLTDSLGNITSFTYNSLSQPLTITDARGNVTTNSYDNKGNLTQTTDALGGVTSFTYDSKGNRLSETNALGQTSTYIYDSLGRMTSMQDALGNISTTTYDPNGNALTQTRSRTNGNATETLVTRMVYDENDRVIKVTDPDGTFTETVYDANGRVASSVDKLGRSSANTYDTQGRHTRMTAPDGTYSDTAYDAEGRRTSSTDQAGRVTTFAYDFVGRLLQTTAPDGTFTSTTYDAAGRVLTSTDAKGQTTAYEYDAAGRRTKVTDALGQSSRYAYDANGNQVRFTDALGRVTQQVYDALNRRVVSILADNSSTTTVYDALGRKIEELDAAGYRKQWVYDALGRLTTAYDALGQATSYTYDEVGNQLTQKDALNRVTTYAYDKLGRRVKRTLPMGQIETMTYDAAGNALTRTDFKGKTTTFGYDLLNRLLSKAPDSSTGESTVRYTYTATGRRATMLDTFGTTSYSYDQRDRLSQKVQKFGTLTYTRDANGNVASISSNNPAGGTQVSYAYDALNRLDTVTDANLGATNYAYDAVGNLSNFRTSNGVTQSYGYNTVNRLTALQATSFDTSLHQLAYYGYTLSATGHRTGVTELDGRHTAYTYDPLWRLKTETISNDTAGKNGSIAYTFDAVGNRLTRTSTVAGLANQSNLYDQNDRLGSDVSDANGNTTQATDPRSTAASNLGLVNDAYNYEDKLRIRNAANGDVIRNVYDGDGNLVCVITNGQVVSYVLDDQNPTGYTQVLEEVTGGANTLLRTYTYGHALLAQDQKNPTTGVWTATWYGYDGHGNVRFLTDSTGAITDRYTYDAFGVILTTSGTTTNAYKYCGERYVDSLGLYNLRARMMNPMTGRFWTMDSYEGMARDPQSLHKYLYASADGVNGMDPSGQATIAELVESAEIWVNSVGTRARVAFSLGSGAIGRFWNELGFYANRVAFQIFNEFPAAEIEDEVAMASSRLDYVVKIGSKVATIEVKYKLPDELGAPMTRLVNQMANSIMFDKGQTVLWSLKEPTITQLNLVTRQLGDLANKVQFVSGVQGLYDWMNLYFQSAPK